MSNILGHNLHIYPAPIVAESRIFRQTSALSRASLFDAIEICGTPSEKLPPIQTLPDSQLIRRVGNAPKTPRSVVGRVWYQILWSRRVYREYVASPLAAVNAHSIAVLPVAALLARKSGALLIYDTHELETETSTSRGIQGRVFKFLERLLIRRCDVVFVVNDLIKEWYESTYQGVEVVSVVNSPEGSTTPGVAYDLRDAFGISSESRIFVHVGNLVASRCIPEIIAAFSSRPDVHLVFLGDGDRREQVQTAARLFPNIHYHPNIESESVVPTLRTADVGICLIQPTCLSYELALPNKAIEYTAARIPFIHNELPAVRRMLSGRLEKFVVSSVSRDLGRVIDAVSNESTADGQTELEDVRLPSWDTESTKMLNVYRRLLARRRSQGSRVKSRAERT